MNSATVTAETTVNLTDAEALEAQLIENPQTVTGRGSSSLPPGTRYH